MYQFIHVESYSRSAPKSAKGTGKEGRSVRYIIDEAIRAEGAHPHIADPEPPLILHGESPEELEDICETWAGSVTDALGRKTRKDALCLLAGIVSAPAEITPDAWQEFRDDSIEWLKKKYGDCLKSVIEHTDEKNPHIHFYVVPELGSRFETVHQGRAASAQAKAEGLKKGVQNTAYNAAMREFQDEFFEDVAMIHGMARIGPGRRRLSTQAWNHEKQQIKAVSLAIKAADASVADARLEAMDIAQKALKKADEIEARAKEAGYQKGLDQVEELPWFRRVAAVVFRAAKQRDELKKTVEELTEERNKLKVDKKSLLIRAKHYWKTGKTISERLKEIELDIPDLQKKANQADELEKEKEALKKELASAKSSVKHYSAIAESYQMREQEELEKNALNDKKPRKRRDFDSDYQP